MMEDRTHVDTETLTQIGSGHAKAGMSSGVPWNQAV